MSIDLSALTDVRRLLLEADLQPIQGQRFQPTGFPDLGPATYQAGGTSCLLVESAQSMANRLEGTIWDEGTQKPTKAAEGISYVVVNKCEEAEGKMEPEFLTSSIIEAHRLNSPYIEKSQGDFFSNDFKNALKVDKKKPVNRRALIDGLFKYDLNSLLHGTFLESLDGRLRISRAISSFVEASNVQIVASGGVRIDRIDASTDSESKSSSDGFGNRPYSREEFTAEKITAFFSVDLQQIRAYGLSNDATKLLTVLALYKIRRLLDGDMRFRTACDFDIKTIVAKRPEGFELPPEKELADLLQTAIKKCAGVMEVTEVDFKK